MSRVDRDRKQKEKDIALFRQMRDYVNEYGYSPSIREIAEMCGLKSTSSAVMRVMKLQQRGWVHRTGYTARSIRIIDIEDAVL